MCTSWFKGWDVVAGLHFVLPVSDGQGPTGTSCVEGWRVCSDLASHVFPAVVLLRFSKMDSLGPGELEKEKKSPH